MLATNNTLSISAIISSFVSNANKNVQEWRRIENFLRNIIRKMLMQKKYGKTLASVMQVSIDDIVEELLSELVLLLVNNDMSTLRKFASQEDVNFEKWVYVSSMGKARNLYKKACARQNRHMGLENIAGVLTVQFDEQLFVSEKLEKAKKAIKELPKCQRQAMEIALEEDDLSSQERANHLGISEQIYNKRIFDARKKLTQLVA